MHFLNHISFFIWHQQKPGNINKREDNFRRGMENRGPIFKIVFRLCQIVRVLLVSGKKRNMLMKIKDKLSNYVSNKFFCLFSKIVCNLSTKSRPIININCPISDLFPSFRVEWGCSQQHQTSLGSQLFSHSQKKSPQTKINWGLP